MSFFQHIFLTSSVYTHWERGIQNHDFEISDNKETVLNRAVNIMKVYPDHVEESSIFWKRRKAVAVGATLGSLGFMAGGGVAFALGAISPWIAIASVIVGLALLYIYPKQIAMANRQLQESQINNEWDMATNYLAASQYYAEERKTDLQIDMIEVWTIHCKNFFKEMDELFKNDKSGEKKMIAKFYAANPIRPVVFDQLLKVIENKTELAPKDKSLLKIKLSLQKNSFDSAYEKNEICSDTLEQCKIVKELIDKIKKKNKHAWGE